MTYAPKSDFLHAVVERDLVQDCTDLEGLDEALLAGAVPGYIGFDCTADSLHVGHLTGIMLLRWLQTTGHKPIALMGGGTTRIGDPSGKDTQRQLLTDEIIAANMDGIRAIFRNYLSFEEQGGNAIQPNNAEWLDELNYIDFLRDYGRHFTINRMLTFDSVRLRLDREQPLTFLEFNYMLLQAYDFLELSRRTGCRLQMGGSDQWGNIVNGVELTRRVDGRQVFGLTAPLLTKPDGTKMGKTAGGAVWLNEDRLGNFEFWQYWRNVEDVQVEQLLKRFTELPLDECRRLGALAGSEINEAKVILAGEVTKLARGEAAARAAEATAREVFERGGAGEDLPTFALTADEAAGGVSIVQLFVKAGLARSGKDARRLISEGGARLADEAVTDAGLVLQPEAFSTGPLKLSAGRKRHALVKLD